MSNQDTQTPQRFFKLLQAGDLAFMDLIEYALVIFGCTKHGKTTLSHFLANNPLQAYKENGGQIKYKLLTSKGAQAKIGLSTGSQTQIPNQFLTTIDIEGSKLAIIDNPGHFDNFGINRILSNAYFHYRIFSKIKNMKFLLVFDYSQFASNVLDANRVFQIFFKSFTNFSLFNSSLIQSTSVIFTKVDQSKTMNDIQQKIIKIYIPALQKSKHFDDQKFNFIKSLMQQCIKNGTLKIFQKAQLGKGSSGNNNYVKQIHQRLTFFTRQIQQKNQQILSQFDKQNTVKMDNIEFSQTNRFKALEFDEKKKQKSSELFGQLQKRGSLMFQCFFNVLQQLLEFLLFQCDQKQPQRKIDQSYITNEKKRQRLNKIISSLKKVNFQYDNQDKYKQKREQIILRYIKRFQQQTKVFNFIERLLISNQIYSFCLQYADMHSIKRTPSGIKKSKHDFERMLLKISPFFRKPQEKQLLGKFLYHLNNYMNEMTIFCIIIIGGKTEQTTINHQLDQGSLGKFLYSITNIFAIATKVTDHITLKAEQFYKLKKGEKWEAKKDIAINFYFKKFPKIILDQVAGQQNILQLCKGVNLDKQHQIHAEILKFKFLQKKYHFLMQLKTLEPERSFKRLNQKKSDKKQEKSDKKQEKNQSKQEKKKIIQEKKKISSKQIEPKKIEQGKKRQQNSLSSSQIAIKSLLKSFILYLTVVKKMKQLVQYKDFQSYKDEIYTINYLVWNYIVKLFYDLYDLKKNQFQQRSNQFTKTPNIRRPEQIQFYLTVILQILSNSKNYTLINEIFGKLIDKYKQKVKSITLESTLTKLKSQSQINILIYDPACYTQFLKEKNQSAKQLIQTTLIYAALLKAMHLKDVALTQCYEVLKYADHCPAMINKIETIIQQIKGQQTHLLRQQGKSIKKIEASLKTKKHFTQFIKMTEEIQIFQCLKPQNSILRKV